MVGGEFTVSGVSKRALITYYARLIDTAFTGAQQTQPMERLPEFIGNHLFLVSLFISLLILLLWNIYGGTLSGVKQIMPAELTRLLNHENAVLIDLRAASEFEARHILGARNIPESEMAANRTELEKLKKEALVFYCGSGMVSAKVARSLPAQGFEKVYCLKGGLPSWQNANLPLTKET